MAQKATLEICQTFGKKKTATAVATVRHGKGLIKVNGQPLHLIEPEILKVKLYEPLLCLDHKVYSKLDIRVKVKGGGYVA